MSAKRIKLISFQISLQGVKTILNSPSLKKLHFKSSRTNSSEKFSFSNSRIIEAMLVPIVLVSTSFYFIEGNNLLDSLVKKDLKIIIENTKKIILKDNPNQNEKFFLNYLIEKLNLDILKEDFKKQKFIQFDTTSKEHQIFFKNNKNKNWGNIVIKIKGCGSEKAPIRMGLFVNKREKSVQIVDIVNKKNWKKI